MWKLFNHHQAEKENEVTRNFCQVIFKTRFNIGFGSPKTDQCSTCLMYQAKMRHSTISLEKKRLETQHHVSVLKAESFCKLLREKKTCFIDNII